MNNSSSTPTPNLRHIKDKDIGLEIGVNPHRQGEHTNCTPEDEEVKV